MAVPAYSAADPRYSHLSANGQMLPSSVSRYSNSMMSGHGPLLTPTGSQHTALTAYTSLSNTNSNFSGYETVPLTGSKSVNKQNSLSKGGKPTIVKQGHMMRKTVLNNWKKRYFVLKSNYTLNVYETKRAASTSEVLPLTNLKDVKFKGKSSFDIHAKSRVWSFACANVNERDEWVGAIKSVAGI